MSLRILTISINTETDVVGARQRARDIAGLCGFGMQDQVRIATSVSELARNVINYATSGKIEFAVEGAPKDQSLVIRVEDNGPGIRDPELVLSGHYHSQTGMGVGLLGAKRLMDGFELDTAPGKGTRITLLKHLADGVPPVTAAAVGALCARLAATAPNPMLAEVQQQNQELLGMLSELKTRQDELLQLTGELEETNRGVIALYAELDEKAEYLRRADAAKSRFLSNMSHEFRTPLSSIRALSKLLLDRIDGELSTEQEKQVTFILNSTLALSEMVNDLLDLAKIESGKIDVRPEHFEAAAMFGALRGMLRPLLNNDAVVLTFDDTAGLPTLYTDEAKLSQILRNFVSNALKFTERGAITVAARTLPGTDQVCFSVTDTGLGIDAAHLELIFEEFGQVENPLQAKVKGTGLGLPLCRNLAQLLRGRVEVDSTPGIGSVFSVIIPADFAAASAGTPKGEYGNEQAI